MQQPKRYRLIQDLPDLPAGSTFVYEDSDDYYDTWEGYWPEFSSHADIYFRIPAEVVESSPDWFAPLTPSSDA